MAVIAADFIPVVEEAVASFISEVEAVAVVVDSILVAAAPVVAA